MKDLRVVQSSRKQSQIIREHDLRQIQRLTSHKHIVSDRMQTLRSRSSVLSSPTTTVKSQFQSRTQIPGAFEPMIKKQICGGDKRNRGIRSSQERSKLDVVGEQSLLSEFLSKENMPIADRTVNPAMNSSKAPKAKSSRSIPAPAKPLLSAQQTNVRKTMTMLQPPAGSKIPTIRKVSPYNLAITQSKSDARPKATNYTPRASKNNRSNLSASKVDEALNECTTTHISHCEQPKKKKENKSSVFDRLYQNNAQKVTRLQKLRQDYLEKEKKVVSKASYPTSFKSKAAKEIVPSELLKQKSCIKQNFANESLKSNIIRPQTYNPHSKKGSVSLQKRQTANQEQSPSIKPELTKSSQTRTNGAISKSVYERLCKQKSPLIQRQKRERNEPNKSIAHPKTISAPMQQKNDTRIPVWERLHASSRRFVQNQQKTTPALFPPKEVGTTKNLPFHRSKTKTATKHKKEGMTSEVFCSKARSNTQPKKPIQSTSHVSLDNGSLTLEIAEGKLHDCTINSLEEVGDDQKTETSDSNADEPVTLDIKAYYEDIRPEMNAELKKTSDPLLLRSKSILADYGAWAAELELKMQHMATISKVVY